MVEEAAKEPILGLDEKKPEPEVEVKNKSGKNEVSQKELDWRQNFTDESLKTDPSMLKFKTVDALGQAYNKLQAKIGKLPSIALQDQHTLDTAKEVLSAVFTKGDYNKDLDKDFKEAAEEFKIPALVANPLGNALKDKIQKTAAIERQNKIDQYKKELQDFNIDNNLERYLSVGLSKVGVSETEYKEIFKDEALNPKVVNLFATIGRKSMSDEHIDITKGGHGGLPSNRMELEALSKELIIKQMHTIDPAQQMELRKQMTEVKAKLQKAINAESKKPPTLLS